MQRSDHDGVRLFSDVPVVDTDTGCEGQTVYILCQGNLADVILGMKLLTRSLPQNVATLQGSILPVAGVAPVVQPTSGLQSGVKA